MNRVSWDLSNESLKSEPEDGEEDDDDDEEDEEEEEDTDEEEEEDVHEEEERKEVVPKRVIKDANDATFPKTPVARPSPSPRTSKPPEVDASISETPSKPIPLKTSTPKPAVSEPPKKPDRMAMFMAK